MSLSQRSRSQSGARGCNDLRERERGPFHLAVTSTLGQAISITALSAFFYSISQSSSQCFFSISHYYFLMHLLCFLDHSSVPAVSVLFPLKTCVQRYSPTPRLHIFPCSPYTGWTLPEVGFPITQESLPSPSNRGTHLGQIRIVTVKRSHSSSYPGTRHSSFLLPFPQLSVIHVIITSLLTPMNSADTWIPRHFNYR